MYRTVYTMLAMPALKISREEVVERISDVFRRAGYDGATLRDISDATGLGRASLYHHFPGGKEGMAREVFDQVNQAVEVDILSPLRSEGTAEERLVRWVDGVGRFYARGGKNCLLGAMVLSGSSDRFAKELAGAFLAWIGALASTLEQAGVPSAEAQRRAENAVGRIQGALVVSRGMKDIGHFQRVLAELPDDLLSG